MIISTYYPLYTVKNSKYWLVRDDAKEKYSSQEGECNHPSLLFHVQQDDYLSTLATILRFFEESMDDTNISQDVRDLQLKIIRNIIGEILYLSKYYKIVPKNKETKYLLQK